MNNIPTHLSIVNFKLSEGVPPKGSDRMIPSTSCATTRQIGLQGKDEFVSISDAAIQAKFEPLVAEMDVKTDQSLECKGPALRFCSRDPG